MLVNGSLAANASCTISLDLQVTATTPGSLTSPAVTLSSNQAPNATAAAINLTVTVPAPTFIMAFAPSTGLLFAPGAASGTLTFTITNNASIQLTNLAFNHTLPGGPAGGLQVIGTPIDTSCGSPNITTSGTPPTIVVFTGGSVAPGGTCTVTITVQTLYNFPNVGDSFTYVNSAVTLTSNQAAPVTVGPVNWTVVRQQ